MFCKNCGHTVEEGKKFCKNCGTVVAETPSLATQTSNFQPKVRKSNRLVSWFVKYKKRLLIGSSLLLCLVLILSVLANGDSEVKSSSKPIMVDSTTLSSIVVDILCPTPDGGGSGGSGTIMTKEGLILTNNHIIPEDRYGNPTVDECIVTLADSQGKIKTVYQGKPEIVPGLSEKDDLAFIMINDSFTDSSGTTYGSYPTTFPNFIDLGCTNSNPQLGDAVRVFGYPAISAGGYYLTVTDGIVSSLPNDGTIVTSATVDHGDSGGLAVDKNGCQIGIPEAVSGDNNASLGILISTDVIAQFMRDIPDQN